jgi:small subunit ribosomal protein S3
MSRQSNPKIIRISSVLRTWDAKWFTDRSEDYRQSLLQDLQLRGYLDKQFRGASISRVEIARQPRETVLTVHTSRPAVVIGRGGSGIEKIQKDLSKIFGRGHQIRINVQEVGNPDTDAAAMATQIVDQLERRMPFRRVMKQAVSRGMQAGAKGIRVSLAGRLNGAEIARTEWLADGNVPLHTFRADISYARRTAYTTYGTIGVKVWINRGELMLDEEKRPGETIGKKQPAKPQPRRTPLADKVARMKKPAVIKNSKRS